MKVFIGAIILTAIIFALAVINMNVICSSIDTLLEMISSLPTSSDDKRNDIADEIARFWSDIIERIAFTTSYSDIDRADDAITEIVSHLRLGNTDELFVSRQKALDALKRLRRLASVTKESIF